ncbi:MAG: hypothetical protein ACAH95_14690 [Fimbriimonas sp.]
MRPDPNKDRNDTIVPEYWTLGEDFQDSIRRAGYESETVEGIAVDIHDILQAADVIRATVEGEGELKDKVELLIFELDHIRWHCDAAIEHLTAAKAKM